MKVYNIKLRVNGELFTEVRKEDVTAAEIALLTFLHKGPDCIVECEESGSVRRTDRAERKRLAALYSYGEMTGAEMVHRLFGVETMPLPQEYAPPEAPDVTDAILEGDERDDVEEIVRTPIAAPVKPQASKKTALRDPATGRILKTAVPVDMLT